MPENTNIKGASLTRRPWATKEWRERRKEKLKDKCEWCGSTKNLTIHHPDYRPALSIWREIARKLFEKSEEYENAQNVPPVLVEHCPRCGSKGIYKRITVIPPYRCSRCGLEFDTPKKREECDSDAFWSAYKEFISKNKGGVDAEFAIEKQKSYERYMSMEGVVTLCKRCNFAIHRGMWLCPVCKEHYFRLSSFKIENGKTVPIQPKTCWSCFVKTPEGKKVLARKKAEEELLSGRGLKTIGLRW